MKALLILLLLTTPCFAEEPTDFLKNIAITLSPAQEAKPTTDDEKLAKAIAEASYYACFVGEDLRLFSYKEVILIVKKNRSIYDKEHIDCSFVEFIKKDIDKNFSNCEGWFKYYENFKE